MQNVTKRNICKFIYRTIIEITKRQKKWRCININRTEFIGNLTADPVINEREWVNNETGEIIKASVCNFTVAADDGFGARKQTTFFRVNAWRKLGESCAKFLKKGRAVYVAGPVRLNNYVDKNNNPHSVIEVRAEAIQFLNNGKGEETTVVETPEPVPDFEY